MKGLFGSLFDFDRDGEISAIEFAAELSFIEAMEKEKKEREQECSFHFNDDEWSE